MTGMGRLDGELRGLGIDEGNVRRLEVGSPDGSGAVSWTIALAATGGLVPGDVRRYQWWYSDPGASPCGSTV